MKFGVTIRGCFFQVLAACLLLTGRLGAGTDPFFDWVSPGESAYTVLKQAALQSGQQNWMAERLRAGLPLPQASARDFAVEMAESTLVSQDVKLKLVENFPSEVSAYMRGRTDLQIEVARLQERIDALEPRLGDIIQAKDRNNYSPLSTPKSTLAISSYFWTTDYRGKVVRGQDSYTAPALFGNNITMTLSGVNGGAAWQFMLAGFILPFNQGEILSNPANQNLFQAIPPNYEPWSGYYSQPQVSRSSASFNNYAFIGAPTYFSLKFDPPWFSNISADIGAFFLPPVDDLLYSPSTLGGKQPFYNGDNVVFSEASPLAVSGLSFSGLRLQKAGQSGWWPFSNTALYLSPAKTDGALDLYFGRLDLRSLDFTWIFTDSNLWTTCLYAGTPEYFHPSYRPYQLNRDLSFGIKGQFLKAGLLSYEWATAAFSSQGPQINTAFFPFPAPLVKDDLNWADQGQMLAFSQSFSVFSILAQASQFGPYFFIGQKGGLTGGGLWTDFTQGNQIGNAVDTTVFDPRPGNVGQVGWQTISNGFDTNYNNSRRVNLQATWDTFFSQLGISGGFATQIQPSGPWIGTSTFLNNRPENGYDWFKTMGGEYTATVPGSTPNVWTAQRTAALLNFNNATLGPAKWRGTVITKDYYGNPLLSGKINWHDLQGLGFMDSVETIVLSQGGVGNYDLREDSIKTINDLRLTFKLDVRDLFRMDLPFLLQGYSDLRDIDESVHLAGYGDGSLLSQSVSEGFLTWGACPLVNLLGYAGYESWTSRASAFPVDTIDDSFGIGVDFLLSPLLTDLVIGARYKWMDHKDLNYSQRDFMGFCINIGTTVNY